MKNPTPITWTQDIFGDMDDSSNENKTKSLAPGTSQWTEKSELGGLHLIFICPCGCRKIRIVPVAGDRKWNWNGDRVKPTLTPSILIVSECGWHGYLTNGIWTTC